MDEPEEGGDSGGDAVPAGNPPGHDERLAHFIAMLSEDSEVSRWKAAEALGRMGDPAAVEELIGTLWDDDARVRLKVAWALGQIGDPLGNPAPPSPVPDGK